MARQVDSALSELLSKYLANWGPVSWQQELADAKLTDDFDLGRAILSLSAIETDSRVIYRKLHIANLDRRQAIREFNISWLAEEAEHGRALKCLATKLGVHETPQDRSARISIRSTVSWPSLAVARMLGSAMEATYLTLGATQEFVALTTYRKAAELVGDQNAALVLRRIAAQEGRHMHFYRGAALVFLDEPRNAYVASQLIGHLWRPPGVDLLGITAWLRAFGPLLAHEDYRSRLLRMDQLLQRLPGFQGSHLMEGFLRRHGFPIPASGRRCARTA
jgi:rubrerythrin